MALPLYVLVIAVGVAVIGWHLGHVRRELRLFREELSPRLQETRCPQCLSRMAIATPRPPLRTPQHQPEDTQFRSLDG